MTTTQQPAQLNAEQRKEQERQRREAERRAKLAANAETRKRAMEQGGQSNG